MQQLRIAQVGQLFESVPPPLYGGTERVVSWLTEALVELGHDVTLFASGDSQTKATLVPVIERSIRLDGQVRDWVPLYIRLLEMVARAADRFDIIHFHIDTWSFPLFTRLATPFVTTLHGRLDLPEYQLVYTMFPQVPLVSISNSQRGPLPHLNWVRTIPHGLPPASLRPVDSPARDYLAFLGRISPEKGIEQAIAIARATGSRLRIAAKVDKVDHEYHEQVVAPQIDGRQIEFIGEIADAQKSAFLGGAKALLFPIMWEEPFGLTMIEALACGTPVVGFRRASVPEVIEDGVTGFIVADQNEAARAVARVGTLDRAAIRARFDARFTAPRMAQDYVDVYRQVIADRSVAAAAPAR